MTQTTANVRNKRSEMLLLLAHTEPPDTLSLVPLEDHIGDIIRKARLHSGVSLDATAEAAGLTPAQLQSMEQDGVLPKPVNFARIGALLGLDPVKLESIARGWEPSPVDTSRWRELRMITSQSGGFAVNCYIVWDAPTHNAALFDAGFDSRPILDLVDEHALNLRYVFVTHGHHDHIAALPRVMAKYQHAERFPNPASLVHTKPLSSFQLGGLEISAKDTPGHTDDGITYVVTGWPHDAPPVAFVGDCLFAGSMGKAPGHAALARRKILEHILSLPPSTLICPGHGPLTTVAEELANNPFF